MPRVNPEYFDPNPLHRSNDAGVFFREEADDEKDDEEERDGGEEDYDQDDGYSE